MTDEQDNDNRWLELHKQFDDLLNGKKVDVYEPQNTGPRLSEFVNVINGTGDRSNGNTLVRMLDSIKK